MSMIAPCPQRGFRTVEKVKYTQMETVSNASLQFMLGSKECERRFMEGEVAGAKLGRMSRD